jgi:hypothetical protein
MIAPPSGMRVWLACGHTDMRKGMDGLAMLAQQALEQDPFSGALFAFRGKLLLPEQRQGHIWPPQLAVHLRPGAESVITIDRNAQTSAASLRRAMRAGKR